MQGGVKQRIQAEHAPVTLQPAQAKQTSCRRHRQGYPQVAQRPDTEEGDDHLRRIRAQFLLHRLQADPAQGQEAADKQQRPEQPAPDRMTVQCSDIQYHLCRSMPL
eukprot:Anaeramoba_flamelloidesc35448_g1_i2.p2 GENE.c35448_g1_i2~~c35448_g1_i2.p2  ORF type:complete len:106 (+),score=10.18 c35448_g1_i2:576-893(+)